MPRYRARFVHGHLFPLGIWLAAIAAGGCAKPTPTSDGGAGAAKLTGQVLLGSGFVLRQGRVFVYAAERNADPAPAASGAIRRDGTYTVVGAPEGAVIIVVTANPSPTPDLVGPGGTPDVSKRQDSPTVLAEGERPDRIKSGARPVSRDQMKQLLDQVDRQYGHPASPKALRRTLQSGTNEVTIDLRLH